MRWIRELLSRPRFHNDLSREIQEHLREKAEELMSEGISREAAEAMARREFGNARLVEERASEVWAWPWIDNLRADLKFAFRQLQKSPGFAAVAILMLMIGIGVNTAAFSIFHHILLQPLSFPEPQHLYSTWEHVPAEGDRRIMASGPDFVDFRDQSNAFSGIAAYLSFTETWTGGREPRTLHCTGITQEFFRVLGMKPILGRLYTEKEFATLDSGTLIISERFWRDELGSDPTIIGKGLTIGGSANTIVGVVDAGPDLFPNTEVWLTLTTRPSWPFMTWRSNKFLNIVGRLKPEMTRAVAEQQLSAILQRAEGEPKDVQVKLEPLKEAVAGPASNQLRIVMSSAAMVLLLICLNTAALLLVRAVRRAPEMAVRMGLGASRARIWQQLLVEGMLLSTLGCAGGLAIAYWGVRLVKHASALRLPRVEDLSLNGTAVTVTLAVVFAVTLLFAWLPWRSVSDASLASGLRSRGMSAGKGQRRSFSTLVVAEITCAVVLSVVAGLLVRSFWRIHQVDPGFQPTRILSGYLRVNNDSPQGRSLWKNILEGTASVPGASSSAAADCIPGIYAATATLTFDDRPNEVNNPPAAQGCWASSDFFQTIGVTLIKGRYFTLHDDLEAPAVVIINAEAARRYWPGENPLGKHITVAYTGPGRRVTGASREREIVGIIGNIRQRKLDQPIEPAVYLPYLQDETNHVLWSMHLYVRSDHPDKLSSSVRAKVRSLYPNQPLESLRTLADLLSDSMAPRTYSMSLIVAFALLALLLSGMGIYGVVSYVTVQRTHEFGIRMALGADRSHVLWDVIQSAEILAGIGILCGTGLALVITGAFKQLLFETTPFDPLSFVGSVLVLCIVALAATLQPAWRAAQLDPRSALNVE
jgi:putative ABC transport system permease protein